MTTQRTDTLFELTQAPPLGVVPQRMYAQTIRQARFGEPAKAFQREVVGVPEIGPNEVLVYVMAAGINYNNVWAALGSPVDVVRGHKQNGTAGDDPGFHIGGSDASGIVYAVGDEVTNVKVGDEVVIHCGMWDAKGPEARRPRSRPGQQLQDLGLRQQLGLLRPVHPRAGPPVPAQAAAPQLGAGRRLHARRRDRLPHARVLGAPHRAAGRRRPRLGRLRRPRLHGHPGRESPRRHPHRRRLQRRARRVLHELGAKGYINRTKFDHWGRLPDWTRREGDDRSHTCGFRAFGKAIWDILGERRSPRIVFEHPGEDTIPTSIFVCDTGGMVVICAGTTGYNADVDLRYLWMRQKRFQGSHFANDAEANAVNDLVAAGKIDPCLSRTFAFDEVGQAHQLMYENKHPNGNMAILVGAAREGLRGPL